LTPHASSCQFGIILVCISTYASGLVIVQPAGVVGR
jgi:hypothetical protein